jgi:hypothetical protein
MITVACRRVVRETAPGGLETRGNGESFENMFEDEDENEDEGQLWMRPIRRVNFPLAVMWLRAT